MIAEIIIIAFAILFFIMGVFLYNGKGSWLIAGYNTASKEEKEKYDEKKICRAMSYLCFVLTVMMGIMAFLGYNVDTGKMDENYMLIFAAVFVVVIITTVINVIRYMNTKCKK